MNPIEQFQQEKKQRIATYVGDRQWHNLSTEWLTTAFANQYVYNFAWLGRPIIQCPIDMVALQEIVWEVKPDLIIETGIAHGGSLILSASLLALLDICEAAENHTLVDPSQPKRQVLGIDIDIRAHNRVEIEKHPLASRIHMIEGSSISEGVITQVHAFAKNYQRILVCLDSMHTHDHVLAELNAYAPLVSVGSYCVVFDTIVEDLPPCSFPDRPWDRGNNPKTAVREFLGTCSEFVIDKEIEDKLLITAVPDGYLKRMR